MKHWAHLTVLLFYCTPSPAGTLTSQRTCVAGCHEEHVTNLDSCVRLPTARSSYGNCKEKFVEPA